MQRMDGICAAITGGTTGIGFVAAQRLIQEGAQAILTGQDQGRVDAAIARLGNGAKGFVARAESPEDPAALAAFVRAVVTVDGGWTSL